MKRKILILLVTILAVAAQAKTTTYSLYAVVSNDTVLTLKASSSSIKGATKYEAKYDWNSSFRSKITKAVIDASCKNYTGTTLEYLFYYCSNLKAITDLSNLKTDNITSLASMFGNCNSLAELDVSSFNTAKVTAMNSMFSGCHSLTKLDLKNFNTANVTTMSWMFNSCRALTELDISSFTTDKVTNMSDMFSGCRVLEEIDITKFNTANVTKMDWMFDYCYALKSIDLSNLNTANVTSMSGMFGWCKALTSIDVTKFNTAKVTSLYDMFMGCESLTSIDVTGFNTENVTNMSGMFDSCSELTSIDVTKFNTAKVTQMSGMFNRCSKLTSIDVTGFNTENVTDMSSMFGRCTALTVLNLSSFNTAKVTNMTDMFYNCSSLKIIYVGDAWTVESVTSGDGMFLGCTAIGGEQDTSYYKDKSDHTYARIDGIASLPGYLWGTRVLYAVVSGSDMTLKCGMVEPGAYGFNTYESWASSFRGSIKHITIDESCRNFNNTSLKCLFNRCSNLEDISGIENLNTENVTVISRLFAYCEKLQSIDVSSLNTSKVTAMRDVFNGCSKLTSLDLRTFDTSQVTDMTEMFQNCTSLKHLDIRTWNTENVTTVQDMFTNCTALTTLNLSNFNTRKVHHPRRFFSGCTNLTTIIVGVDWSTDAFYYSNDMFSGCTSLVGQYGTKVGTSIDATNAHTGKGGYLTGLTRSLKANAANGKRWTTFYVDNAGYTFDDGEEACAYTATCDDAGGTLTLRKLGTDGRHIPANTPVVVVTSEDNAEVSMTVDNTLADFDGENALHGVDTDTPVSTITEALGSGTLYVLGNKNSHFGFHRYEGTTMAAHKAFLPVGGAVALSRSLTMVFEGDDADVTGIGSVQGERSTVNDSDAWYTLDGRRLDAPPTAKGIYINNGRKCVVR